MPFSTVELYALSSHVASVTLRRIAIGHFAASFVVIAVIVVCGVAFVSLMNGPSSKPSVVGVSETTFYSGASPQGIQLQIKLNVSAVPQGGALQAHILLVNTLSESVLLHPDFAANPNIDQWNWDDYLCGMSPVEHTFGFALLEGHYTAANLSQAGAPLNLAPPVAIPCPNSAYGESYIQNVEFAPNSDMATFSANANSSGDFTRQTIRMQLNATTGMCTMLPYQYTETNTVGGVATATTGTAYSWSCGTNGVDSITGYWDSLANCHSQSSPVANSTGSQNLYDNCFHQFTAGPYTVVAEDLWNQTAFAYFDVRGISLQGFSLCASNCGYPSPYLSGFIYFDGSAPLKNLQLVVNGTDQGVQPYTGNSLAKFVEWYKGGFQNPPVVRGEIYLLQFIATFEDNSTATATTTVVAD